MIWCGVGTFLRRPWGFPLFLHNAGKWPCFRSYWAKGAFEPPNPDGLIYVIIRVSTSFLVSWHCGCPVHRIPRQLPSPAAEWNVIDGIVENYVIQNLEANQAVPYFDLYTN